MENKNPYGKYQPRNSFYNNSNNLRKEYIKSDLRKFLPPLFELKENKEEIEYEIKEQEGTIGFFLNELQPERIEIIDDFYETFIIIPENIDSSAYNGDEIVLFGDKSLRSYIIRLSDRELIGIDGYKLLPFERNSVEVNGYKIFRIGYGI